MTQPIGIQLRAIRLQLRLSQQAIADTVGVTQTSISSWECGTKSPSFRDAHTWARTLQHRLVVIGDKALIGDLVDLMPNIATFRQGQGATQHDLARAMWRSRRAVSNTELRIQAGDGVRLATVQAYLSGLDCSVGVIPAGYVEPRPVSSAKSATEVTCDSCGLLASHKGRGLCDPCHRWHSKTGTLSRFPLLHTWIETRDRVREYAELRRQGLSRREIAAQLGVTLRSVERYAAAVRAAEAAATTDQTEPRSEAA
ncbi:helix-turn-helix domain-containing protein [Nonomuraea sp. 10N515B]|uniref:helix-turn-helix domain-containing protein n=1 Tax=Nonomuraea sp. 10N515B TaxID=3457422 RepID=UPI003FCC90C6